MLGQVRVSNQLQKTLKGYAMKKSNAYKMIRKAMIDNERSMFTRIRYANKQGFGFDAFMSSHASYNALQRLEDKGRIRFRKVRGLKNFSKQGYWTLTKGSK